MVAVDDPEAVLGLMHGAFGRVSTVTGVLRHWRRSDLGQRAIETALIVRHVSMVRAAPGSPQEREDVQRVWFASPSRYRSETISAVGHLGHLDPQGLAIDDGEVGWLIGATEVTKVSSGVLDHDLLRLLDPTWTLTHDFMIEGQVEIRGRPVLEVTAAARAHVPRSGNAADMAAKRRLLVDAELGFLHQAVALVDDEAYDILELQDIELDSGIDDELFSPQLLPGTRINDHSVRTFPSMSSRRGRLKRILHR